MWSNGRARAAAPWRQSDWQGLLVYRGGGGTRSQLALKRGTQGARAMVRRVNLVPTLLQHMLGVLRQVVTLG